MRKKTKKWAESSGRPSRPSPSAVHAVVDAVDEVGLVRGQGDEVALVLLEDGLDLLVDARDVVDLRHLLEGAVRGDEARRRGEEAGKLAVGLDVGVVDVHLVRAAEVLDGVV